MRNRKKHLTMELAGTAASAEDEESPFSGASNGAFSDNPRNTPPGRDHELLVVSVGTSFHSGRAAAIKAIEDDMETAFPGWEVRRGFTAGTIIERIYRRDGERIDHVRDALDKAVDSGVKNLLVQPTFLMNGCEYGNLHSMLEEGYADKFESIRIGAPLLATDDDFTEVAGAMVDVTANGVTDGKTAVCYMGHGTTDESNSIYVRMQRILEDAGYANYFIGTMEAAPTAEDLVKLVQEGGYEKVILRPMMIVAGSHAISDMADENNPKSWYSVFSAAGLSVVCQISGLGEIEAVRQLLIDHAKAAEALSESKITSQSARGAAL